MNRRDVLLSVAGGLSAVATGPLGRTWGATSSGRTGLGVCIYCLSIRRRAERAQRAATDFADPLRFLDYCCQLGAGGVQVPLGTRDDAYTAKLRKRAEDRGMFIEGIVGLPRDEADLERFEAEVRTAKRAGANAIRVVIIPGRRYERFHSADEFRRLAERGVKSLERAEPVAARHGVRLAVENHKDQRVPERLEVFRRISSEYVGACVDTGNSFALLEDPMEVVEAYAPWAFSVHLKDQAVREYEDGFLFADAPLGEGFFDLAGMVKVLRAANPQVPFSLEMITRDPLKVPCLTEDYWATFADVPGSDLARTLRVVRENARETLPAISDLPPDEQVKREEENVRRSLAYARDHLGL
jgi:sugar phosphate isomerase/epimerase